MKIKRVRKKMKIKCADGIMRRFEICKYDKVFYCYIESSCLECGALFGVSDTRILKPKWKEHICKGVLKDER